MNELEWLPNIGKVLAEGLSATGIETASEMNKSGSARAALRLVADGSSVCLNRL
jgi:hypothetical protein